jgi:3',5'-cyclic AMP phosphodiesterase CpdA
VKLYAISDLHVASSSTRRVIAAIAEHPDDWLILAGDIGETIPHLEWTLRTLRPRFRQLVWVPGNHDLWTLPSDPNQARGEARYLQLVELCHALDVITPEDPYPVWNGGDGAAVVLAPLFLLYDYSFRRPGSTKDEAMVEAVSAGVVCTDEFLLHPDPFPSREAWCRSRVERTAARLAAVPVRYPTVLISHFPLRQDLVFLPRIPQFSLWCGTTLTEDWHQRFHALAVVYGHLHIPRTSWRHEVRFEEVSIGQAPDWAAAPSPSVRLRKVLPYP